MPSRSARTTAISTTRACRRRELPRGRRNRARRMQLARSAGGEPVASLAAMENASSVTLPPGEARTLAVQALDENGAPLNGVTILFRSGRATRRRLRDRGCVASTASLPLMTETQTALGLRADGVAQARIRIAVDAPAQETEVLCLREHQRWCRCEHVTALRALLRERRRVRADRRRRRRIARRRGGRMRRALHRRPYFLRISAGCRRRRGVERHRRDRVRGRLKGRRELRSWKHQRGRRRGRRRTLVRA